MSGGVEGMGWHLPLPPFLLGHSYLGWAFGERSKRHEPMKLMGVSFSEKDGRECSIFYQLVGVESFEYIGKWCRRREGWDSLEHCMRYAACRSGVGAGTCFPLPRMGQPLARYTCRVPLVRRKVIFNILLNTEQHIYKQLV